MSKKVLETLSQEDILLIKTTLIEQVDKHQSTGALKVFELVKDKLSVQIDESHFRTTLALMLENGMIEGYITKRGRNGGIYKKEIKVSTPDDHPTIAIPKPITPIIPPPIPQTPYLSKREPVSKTDPIKNKLYDLSENFFLKIKEEVYKIPCNKLYIKGLLEKAFEAQEDINGDIEFLGIKYTISNQKTFENVLLWFLNAVILRTSDKKNAPVC